MEKSKLQLKAEANELRRRRFFGDGANDLNALSALTLPLDSQTVLAGSVTHEISYTIDQLPDQFLAGGSFSYFINSNVLVEIDSVQVVHRAGAVFTPLGNCTYKENFNSPSFVKLPASSTVRIRVFFKNPTPVDITFIGNLTIYSSRSEQQILFNEL